MGWTRKKSIMSNKMLSKKLDIQGVVIFQLQCHTCGIPRAWGIAATKCIALSLVPLSRLFPHRNKKMGEKIKENY